MLKLYYFSIFLINLVKILLQRIVGHAAGQVVALLALGLGAAHGGALLLAVHALQRANRAMPHAPYLQHQMPHVPQ